MDLEIMKEYTKKTVIFVLGIIMFSATAAGIVFPILKGLGLYSTVMWVTVIIFEGCILIEDIIGFSLIRRSIKEKVLSKKTENIVKIYFVLVLNVNLNLITWFFPSKESWMFAFYFVILMDLVQETLYSVI